MEIIEQEAVKYGEFVFFNGNGICDIENLSDKISSKLYSFKRNKDKLHFLNVLRKEILTQKLEHEKTCTTNNCGTSAEKDAGLFVVDQEIEEISQSYDFEPKRSDEFSSEQKSELYNSLNEIKEKLTKLGYGQEIIFNEIDELKDHLNLGKKNWFQLLKGKLFDLTVSKALEKSVVEEIFDRLADGFENLPQLIDKI